MNNTVEKLILLNFKDLSKSRFVRSVEEFKELQNGIQSKQFSGKFSEISTGFYEYFGSDLDGYFSYLYQYWTNS